MKLYIAQDYRGNVWVTDERDCLPPDVTDFHEAFLPEKDRHSDDPVLYLEIGDCSEIFSLERRG